MLTFLSIACVGAALFLVSLFFGGDHDISDALHAGDGHGGDSIFSIRSLLLFAIGFGGAGTIILGYGANVTVAVSFGCLFGIGMAFLGLQLNRWLQQQQGDSTIRAENLLGTSGRVTMEIPEHGCGQVLLTDQTNRNIYRRAYTSGESIREGTFVQVENLIGDAVVVSPLIRNNNRY